MVSHPSAPEELAARGVADQVVAPRTSKPHAHDAGAPRVEGFSAVRVHADPAAADSARAVHAKAYTVGNHIVFGHGQFDPATIAGRRLLVHELAHVVQQGIAGATGLFRSDGLSAQERQLWIEAGKQRSYGPLPTERRTRMATQTGQQAADEILWTASALMVEAERIRTLLRESLGPDKDLKVTSVVKAGEHTDYRKMDVVPAGTTTWEELAAAAVHAGFWVHAEGVTLDGKLWPLSPNATGPHLDLYLSKLTLGDFEPAPGAASRG